MVDEVVDGCSTVDRFVSFVAVFVEFDDDDEGEGCLDIVRVVMLWWFEERKMVR